MVNVAEGWTEGHMKCTHGKGENIKADLFSCKVHSWLNESGTLKKQWNHALGILDWGALEQDKHRTLWGMIC